MLSDDVCNQQSNTARRGGAMMAGVALALLMAACGSEAENAKAPARESAAESEQTAGESTAAKTDAAVSESSGSGDKTMMADTGGATKTAAKEEKKEQKREPMDGYTVYHRFCVTCHKTGMNGAPKYGNDKAWEPRITKGEETLHKHAIEGFRAMPPKGGIAGLYDQEVKDAVDYMVNAVGGWNSSG